MSIVLAGLELHLPFAHPDALDFLETVAETFKVTDIVCVGDLFDAHANSRFDHDPDGMSAGHEVITAIDMAEEVYELFPSSKFCIGNHDGRIEKAAYKAGIPRKAIKTLAEIYDLPSTWEVGEYFVIDGVMYEHGDRFGAGAYAHVKAVQSNMRSTVMGHIHTSFGVEYVANRERLLFGAVTGALINPDSYAAAYGKQYAKKSILGSFIIKDGEMVIPVPMILDSRGRWTRRI